jgi:anti-sigma regulatory factor (Ser/Thr protein kinase)
MIWTRHAEHLRLCDVPLPDPDARITLEATLACLPDLEHWIEQLGVQFDLSPLLQNRIEVCLTELLANLISYGYTDGRAGAATLSLWRQPDRYVVCVEDDGRPFDPSTHELPPQPNSLEDANASGRGIPLVRQFADSLQYRRHGAGNQLMLGFLAKRPA